MREFAAAGLGQLCLRTLRRVWAACALLIAALVITPAAAQAGTATNSLTVQVTMPAACTIGAATLTFPSSSGTSLLTTALTASTNVSVTCTNSSPYSIGMDPGANFSTSRRMASAGAYIPYGLYLDSNDTQAWTTTTASASCSGGANTCYLGTGSGAAQLVPIYGKVPTVAVAPAPGTYSDTVTMTVTY